MLLSKLLEGVKIDQTINFKNIDIDYLSINSKDMKENSLYFAIKGFKIDGHKFIDNSIENGAKVIICEDIPNKTFDNIVYLKVNNSRKVEAVIAQNFYKNRSKQLKIIGITGTNGKTSITYILESIFSTAGKKTAIIGTIGYKIGDKKFSVNNTTPDAIELAKIMDKMVDQKVDILFMEVSSHSLDLYRVYGIEFDCVVFTNLSQDHLDFHENMESYFNAKKKLFTTYLDFSNKENRYKVINIDDNWGKKLFNQVGGITFGFKNGDYKISDLKLTLDYIKFKIIRDKNGKEILIKTDLIGKYNVENILGAVVVADLFLVDKRDIEKGLSLMKRVPGRLEQVENIDQYNIFIDYAHSPDAIENVVSTIKPLVKGKLITILGAGGDRDRSKRDKMALNGAKYSDIIILTSDNPRFEDPDKIIDQLEKPLKNSETIYYRITLREEAIKFGIDIMNKDDCIVICGKGHEDYQIIGDKKYPFSDYKIAQKYLLQKREDVK